MNAPKYYVYTYIAAADVNLLMNIKIEYFSPNFTSMLQLLDFVIINSA
jgi:hypothetical protein